MLTQETADLPEAFRHLGNPQTWTTFPNPLLARVLRLEASHLAKLVLLALHSRARMRHPEAGAEALGDLLRVSPRTVRRALEELRRLGLVERGKHGWRALEPGPQEARDRRVDRSVQAVDKFVHIEDKVEDKEKEKDPLSSPSSSLSPDKKVKDLPPLPSSTEEEDLPKTSKDQEKPSEREAPRPEEEPLPSSSLTWGEDHLGKGQGGPQPRSAERRFSSPPLWTRVRSALGEELWKELQREVGRGLEGKAWFRFVSRLAAALGRDGEAVLREGVKRALEAIALGAAKDPARYLLAVLEDPEGRWKPAFRARQPQDPRLRELEAALFLVPPERWGREAKAPVQARYAGQASPDGSRVFLEAEGLSRAFSLEEALAFRVQGVEVVL